MQLADQKGIYEASAHVWIESFFQTSEQLQVHFLIGISQFEELLPVSDPSTSPWEQVVHLSKYIYTSVLKMM